MDKFEKLAAHFECMGELMTIPGFEETMKQLTDDSKSGVAKMGKLMNLVGTCMRQCPETMKRIIALDNDLTLEEVESMDEKTLAPMMIRALSGETASFFASGSVQDRLA